MFIGAVANINIVWLIADCFNALMAVPNLIALILLSGVVVKALNDYFKSSKKPFVIKTKK